MFRARTRVPGAGVRRGPAADAIVVRRGLMGGISMEQGLRQMPPPRRYGTPLGGCGESGGAGGCGSVWHTVGFWDNRRCFIRLRFLQVPAPSRSVPSWGAAVAVTGLLVENYIVDASILRMMRIRCRAGAGPLWGRF